MMTLYIAMEDSNVFEAIYLYELTINELIEKMTKAIDLQVFQQFFQYHSKSPYFRILYVRFLQQGLPII
jgi:hypothetical protein